MTVKPGAYVSVLAEKGSTLKWAASKHDPKGVFEALLHRHIDGSYSHLLRIETGVEFPEPVTHDFFEEAYYISGEMLNTRTKEKIKGGTYVFHKPGESHGPFLCLKECMILEFRYYK